MLITTELATIVGERCFRETHPDPRPDLVKGLSCPQPRARAQLPLPLAEETALLIHKSQAKNLNGTS